MGRYGVKVALLKMSDTVNNDDYHRQNCKRRYIDLPSSLYLYIDTSRHILHQMDENKQVATRECTLIPGEKIPGGF